MERTWIDRRTGERWEVESMAVMPRMEPGRRLAMMDEVPWHLWFRAATGAAYDTHVSADIGMGMDDLSDDTLQQLLDRARQR